MRILSKFVDYYDFVGKRYGEDADCVYLRGTIREHRGLVVGPRAASWSDFPDDSLDDYFRLDSLDGQRSRYLNEAAVLAGYHICRVVAGPHVVTLVEHRQHHAVLDPARHASLLVDDHRSRKREKPKRLPPPVPADRVEAIVRAVNAPVFLVRKIGPAGRKGADARARTIYFDEHVPVLKGFGFPQLFAPEVIWQDIYTTLTSVLRHDPDKAPPVMVAEKYRIEGAGFDLKTSFRHPVNSPAAAAKRRR